MNNDICDAIRILIKHPRINNVRSLLNYQGDGFIVEADFDTDLPSTWKARGQSPSEVKSIEEVQILFPADFPNHAPLATLRPDFNANLPHINPHNRGDRVPPCISEGDLLEVLHDGGFGRMVLQLFDWLEKASENSLINSNQGWEPIRRNIRQGLLEIDAESVPKSKPKLGGLQLYTVNNIWHVEDAWSYANRANIYPAQIFRGRELIDICEKVNLHTTHYEGNTFLAVCWPVTEFDGQAAIHNDYKPDTIKTLQDLISRATDYGCLEGLQRFISIFADAASTLRYQCVLPVYVCFPVKRPFSLIGLPSDYELLVYRINGYIPEGIEANLDHEIQAISLITPMSKPLLKRASGISLEEKNLRTMFVGCGSLGSKAILHVARAGYVPEILVDNGYFVAHNAARHVLFPKNVFAVGTKAHQIGALIDQFQSGKSPLIFPGKVQDFLTSSDAASTFLQDANTLIINTTGAASVRQFLNRPGIQSRVMEACVAELGEIGILTIEGPNRNPTTNDLMAHAFELMRTEGKLNVPDRTNRNQLQIGVGCNSITLPMSDARISLVAAGVGQTLLDIEENGLPTVGKLVLGKVQLDGMSVIWQHNTLNQTHVADLNIESGWTVRILNSAHEKIMADILKYPTLETGGLIVGRISPLAREVIVTDVLSAPPDSKRYPEKFTLGMQNRTAQISEYESSAKGVLSCLGTWHSHLLNIGPSDMDRKTAKELYDQTQSTTVLLISRPDGYSAIVQCE